MMCNKGNLCLLFVVVFPSNLPERNVFLIIFVLHCMVVICEKLRRFPPFLVQYLFYLFA